MAGVLHRVPERQQKAREFGPIFQLQYLREQSLGFEGTLEPV